MAGSTTNDDARFSTLIPMHRRAFLRRATAASIGLRTAGALTPLVQAGQAQPATPDASPSASPAASPVSSTSPVSYDGPVGTLSISREEYHSALEKAFPFEDASRTGGQVVHVMTSDISTVNPILSVDIYSSWIGSLCNDNLVNISPIDGRFVPGIADSWEIADDGVTYTFHLNPDAT